MNPDKPTIETEQRKFSVAFTNLDEWIKEQERNKQAGRIDIDTNRLMEIISDFLSATRSLRMVETDEEKKAELSKIEAKSKEALEGFGTVTDLWEQMDVFVAAKRLLLEAHRNAKKLLPQ